MSINSTTHYTCGPGFGTRGQTAYDLRSIQRMSWEDIAVVLMPPSLGVEGGDPAAAALAVARKYARAKGLLWPIKLESPPKEVVEPTPTPSKQERAYLCRSLNMSWVDVAAHAGYQHPQHAITGARKYAERSNLPWPIVTPPRVSA